MLFCRTNEAKIHCADNCAISAVNMQPHTQIIAVIIEYTPVRVVVTVPIVFDVYFLISNLKQYKAVHSITVA